MNNEYYGVATTPTSDFLAHYGIKGMKWGVRKAIDRGSDRALSRQYRKASKKLAKLQNRANTEHQQNIIKSAKRDQKLAGAVGGASLGIATGKTISSVSNAIKQAQRTGHGVGTITLPIGAGIAAGAIAANAVRKKIAKNRLSEEGHAKAVKEASTFKKEMQKAFKGTEYEHKLTDRANQIAKKKRGRTISHLSSKDQAAYVSRAAANRSAGSRKRR